MELHLTGLDLTLPSCVAQFPDGFCVVRDDINCGTDLITAFLNRGAVGSSAPAPSAPPLALAPSPLSPSPLVMSSPPPAVVMASPPPAVVMLTPGTHNIGGKDCLVDVPAGVAGRIPVIICIHGGGGSAYTHCAPIAIRNTHIMVGVRTCRPGSKRWDAPWPCWLTDASRDVRVRSQ